MLIMSRTSEGRTSRWVFNRALNESSISMESRAVTLSVTFSSVSMVIHSVCFRTECCESNLSSGTGSKVVRVAAKCSA